MDYSLIVLGGLIVAALVVSTTFHSQSWPGRPGAEYHRVFSSAAIGLLFAVAGVTGWDLSHSHGSFRGIARAAGPVWWQVGVGMAALTLSAFFAWRVWSRPASR